MKAVVAEVAADVAQACDAIGARWVVIGAQAAILYGVARSTQDVDLIVDLGEASVGELVRALDGCGLHLRVRDADEFIAATRVLPLSHRTGTPVDIALAGSALEAGFFERARTVTLDGTPVRVVALPDAIVMKVLAGRARDVDDVIAMLVANPELDPEPIRSELGLLEAALDQSDLVPLFEQTLRRAQRARAMRAR